MSVSIKKNEIKIMEMPVPFHGKVKFISRCWRLLGSVSHHWSGCWFVLDQRDQRSDGLFPARRETKWDSARKLIVCCWLLTSFYKTTNRNFKSNWYRMLHFKLTPSLRYRNHSERVKTFPGTLQLRIVIKLSELKEIK